MKRINQAEELMIHSFGGAITAPTLKEIPTEQEIIHLSDKFLTNGFHFVKVRDVEHGRSLMQTFLQSLNYYHEVACLTTSDRPLNNSVINLFKVLETGGWLRHPYDDLCEFLCDHFYSDFLWIEASHDLVTADWYDKFEQYIHDLSCEKKMPIMFVSYQR